MSSPSMSWWDAFVTTVEHPINSVQSAYSEATDPNVSLLGAVKAAATGRPPQSQIDAIKQQTAAQVLQAGGSEADAQAAANEVQSYVDSTGGTAEANLPNLPTTGELLGFGTGTIVILVLLIWLLHEF